MKVEIISVFWSKCAMSAIQLSNTEVWKFGGWVGGERMKRKRRKTLLIIIHTLHISFNFPFKVQNRA